MPEMLEVEQYRRLADRAVGRRIVEVRAPDAWYLKRGTTAGQLRDELDGATITGTRRVGKLLLVDVGGDAPGYGTTLGLRFGMTGRLVLDGEQAIERLEYGSGRDRPEWDRFGLGLDGGGLLRIQDPRRLGGVELAPDEAQLGVDAAAVGAAELGRVLRGSAAPLKARLMDQARLAGLGNLLTDEILWRAGLDPARPAGGLDDAERRRLHRHLRATLAELDRRGGSHTGDLQVARVRGAACPRDGAPLARRTIGGRTTYSCPVHQR